MKLWLFFWISREILSNLYASHAKCFTACSIKAFNGCFLCIHMCRYVFCMYRVTFFCCCFKILIKNRKKINFKKKKTTKLNQSKANIQKHIGKPLVSTLKRVTLVLTSIVGSLEFSNICNKKIRTQCFEKLKEEIIV